MGAGGRMPTSTFDLLKRVPCEKPPFTLGDLKRAIPPHCFKRSLLRSFSYLVYDLCISYLFFSIANNYFHLLPFPLAYIAWPIYWILQGSIQLGVLVIGHECGHHAFSDYQLVDDIVGLILHSSILIPYFSWKFSHRRHHANTGSLENDEVFVPTSKTKIKWYLKYLNNPAGRLMTLAVTLVLGWPLYLVFNVSGRSYDRFACHYDPYSPIYSDKERLQIYISDIGISVTTYILYQAAMAKGLSWVICIYGVPVIIVYSLIVMITYLHHTHPSLPHFNDSEWEWLRGALATVDRDYGLLNKVFHNVTDTHVIHHLFTTMPHYHAKEATEAIRPILGKYYKFDDTPFLKALWREAKECLFVESDDPIRGVFWYKNK